MPARIAAQAGANCLVSFALRGDVDRRINRQSGLRDARCVFVFEILTNVFDGIIERRFGRLRRLVISLVGQLNRPRLRGIDF